MEFRYQKLRQDYTALKSTFEALGHQLAEAAHDTSAKGLIPNEKLAEAISSARRQFDAVRSGVFALAQDMLVPSVPALDNLRSLSSVEQLLAQATDSETQRHSAESERGRALAVLDQVLRLRHRDSPDFKPLADCQRQAEELHESIGRTRWPESHPATANLLGDRHAFNALLTLVAKGSELDDESYARLEELVSNAFGRTLGVALSRGKLTLAGGAAPAAAEPPAREERQPAAPAIAEPPLVETLAEQPIPVMAAAPSPFMAATPPVSVVMEPAPVEPPREEPPAMEAMPPVPTIRAEPEPEPLREADAVPEVAIPPAPGEMNDTVEIAREEIQQAVASRLEGAHRASTAMPTAPREAGEPLKAVATDATMALAEAVNSAEAISAGPGAPEAPAPATSPEPAAAPRPAARSAEDRTGEPPSAARPQRWGFWRGNR